MERGGPGLSLVWIVNWATKPVILLWCRSGMRPDDIVFKWLGVCWIMLACLFVCLSMYACMYVCTHVHVSVNIYVCVYS